MEFILFVWPLMAYIIKWAVALLVLYVLGSKWAVSQQNEKR